MTLARERQTRALGLGPADLQPVAGQRQVKRRLAITAPGLQVGVGQGGGSRHACRRSLHAEPGELLGAEIERDGDPVARGGQLQRASQASRLGLAAAQRGRRHSRRQPHQFAVIDSRIGQQRHRSVFGVQPQPAAFDQDQGTAAVGTGRPAGELFDQTVERSERQCSIAPARLGHRSHQTDPAGRHPEPARRPGQADRIIDLDPLNGHIGIVRIADGDAADETVQLQTLDFDLGRNAALVQPADQDFPRGGAPVQPRQSQQNGDHDEKDQRCDCDPAPYVSLGRSGLGRLGRRDVDPAHSQPPPLCQPGTRRFVNIGEMSHCETGVAFAPQ